MYNPKDWILIDVKQNRLCVLVRDPESDHDGIAMYGVLNKFDDFQKAVLYASGVADGQRTMNVGFYDRPTDPTEIRVTPEARQWLEARHE